MSVEKSKQLLRLLNQINKKYGRYTAMIQHFKSFTELMEVAVLPLLKEHPEAIQLMDGKKASHNLKRFATFEFEAKTWRINSDTHVVKLLAAYELENAGQKPFVEAKTNGKRSCLRLSNQMTQGPKGLYIYEK